MTVQSSIAGELSFKEMLSDPIVQTVMARDGITRRDLEDMIEAAREGKGTRRMRENEMGSPQQSALILER